METNLNVADKGWHEREVIKQQHITGPQVRHFLVIHVLEQQHTECTIKQKKRGGRKKYSKK